MSYCHNCGESIAEAASVCPTCGVSQSASLEGGYEDRDADQRYCQACGSLISRAADACPECGVSQSSGDALDSEKVVAGVLALLLGGIGAHKFYQGNMKIGVLYLCFFWTGLPAALGLVEGILMLVADDREYDEKYADGSILGSIDLD